MSEIGGLEGNFSYYCWYLVAWDGDGEGVVIILTGD